MSDAGIEAVNCVVLMNVVALLAPLTWIAEPGTKFAPLTVNVNPEPPATAPAGDNAESPGIGLFTVNARAALVPPPGVDTTIDNEPAVARSALVRTVDS